MERYDVPVNVPHGIRYDLIVGGACRDAIIGVKPRDYDLWYCTERGFYQAIEHLNRLGAKSIGATSRAGYPSKQGIWFGKQCAHSVWIKGRDVFDMMYFPEMEQDELKTLCADNMCFGVNACFQEYGGSIYSKARPCEYESRELEPNASTMSTVSILRRSYRLFKRGWKPGAGLTGLLFKRLDEICKNVDRFLYSEERAIICTGNGYSGTLDHVDFSLVWQVFLKHIPDDHMLIGFLSSSDDIIRVLAKENNRRKNHCQSGCC